MIAHMTQGSGKWLKKVLNQAAELQKSNQQTLAVFDLDSTLFDVSPRLERILHDFAELPETQKKYPETVFALRNAKTERTDWGIRQAIIRAGLHRQTTEFHEAVKNYWIASFFTNHYLQYDVVYPGAADYVRRLSNLGCDIIYLSGRDQTGMWDGTVEALKKHNFPLDPDHSQIVLKPVKGSDDAEFKRDWFLGIPQGKFAKIWFFENEPLNVNLIEQHLPEIDILFFESTHSGKAEIPAHLPKIFHFLTDEE